MASATTDNAITFPAATAAGQDADTIGLYTALTGGSLLWSRSITTNRPALTLGQNYEIPAGDIVVESSTGGDLENAGRVAELQGILAGTRYGGLIQSGSELSGSGYTRESYAFANWTLSATLEDTLNLIKARRAADVEAATGKERGKAEALLTQILTRIDAHKRDLAKAKRAATK